MMREAYVTGVGMVSALGAGAQLHGEAVKAGRGGLSSQSFFDGVPPDPCICGMVPDSVLSRDLEDTAADRADRLLDLAVGDCVINAGLSDFSSTDMIIGNTLGNMHAGSRYYRQLRQKTGPDPKSLRGFPGCAPVSRVAQMRGIGGRRWAVCSACAGGTVAVGRGFLLVGGGMSECVLAGGFDALSPFVVAGFASLRLVSPRECKPFDVDRDGLNPGEGAAVLAVETRKHAKARGAGLLARIEGFGGALEAYHHTRADPEGTGVETAIRKALYMAGVGPDAVDHVHLHGTATPANDLSEYNGCRAVFGRRLPEIPVCSTKSMTGHTYGAAGALAAGFGILSLQTGMVPPTLHHERLDERFIGLSVSSRPVLSHPGRVVTVSLGFGGEAFALVLSKVVGE